MTNFTLPCVVRSIYQQRNSQQVFKAGVGNLFSITGLMICALSLAGRKMN